MKNNTSQIITNAISFLVVVAVAILFWDRVKTPVVFVVTLGVLIAIHEWGHFIAARASGVHVYEFALGFGPKLVTYMRKNGTDYTIRAFPLGGFVNPKGMQPDDPITPDGLNGRRPAERALVYLAGPLMNAILGVAIFLFSGFLLGSPDETKTLVGQVNRKSVASQMEVVSRNGQPATDHPKGLRSGDVIIEVNNEPIKHWTEVPAKINPHAGREVALTVRRGEETLVLTGVPRMEKTTQDSLVITEVPPGTALDVRVGDQLDQIDGKYPGTRREEPHVAAARILREKEGEQVTLLIWRDGKTRLVVEGPAAPLKIEVREVERERAILGFVPTPGVGPRMGLAESVESGYYRLGAFFQGLAAMFSRPKQLGDNVGGVIAIGAILGQVGNLPLAYYFGLLGSLSLSLAIFNLLPIPILDGGHMLILTWEVLRRRRLEPDTHRAVALVGLLIIGVLFILITWKDITRHIL
jgi:regulator of sigma E protease